MTVEGKKMDREHPRPEYPTPQFQRDSFLSLNGIWDFCLDDDPNNHFSYPYDIVVPFAVESELSGLQGTVKPGQIMHYRKRFTLPDGFNRGRVLIHFEAIDQVCDVFLNGIKIAHHENGYLPFTADCMELKPGENEILVDVLDDTASPFFPRGKQSLRPHGIWYHATSGIWGDVWIESVPNQVIQSIRVTPLFDERKVYLKVQFEGRVTSSKVSVLVRGNEIASGELNSNAECTLDVARDFKPWTPEDPFLYDLDVTVNSDHIQSYFAMRKFSVTQHRGHPVFALNNKPFFLTGVLDQGYYSDGGLTAASDEAILADLRMLKDMGFNMVRKHIKIEPMRWYYHCDRLGLIVIQDFVNVGDPVKLGLFILAPFFRLKIDDTTKHSWLGVGRPESRAAFEESMSAVVDRLYNVPCIAVWTLFNEGWGQFDSVRLTGRLKELDPTRLVDSTSGWFDQGAGDFDSRHVYFRKINLKGDDKRILSVSECGAYSLVIEGHCETKKRTTYKYYHDLSGLTKAVKRLYQEQILPQRENGLSVVVYTQLSDVEAETNGLVTYDRKVVKVPPREMKALNELLRFPEGGND